MQLLTVVPVYCVYASLIKMRLIMMGEDGDAWTTCLRGAMTQIK